MLRPAIPLCLLLAACAVSAEVPSVHFATGIKIVEPAQDRAMVWVRLTRDAAAADRSRPPQAAGAAATAAVAACFANCL